MLDEDIVQSYSSSSTISGGSSSISIAGVVVILHSCEKHKYAERYTTRSAPAEC